ncbi:FAD binding domain-containing protein [Aspergillus campestris IBT 28561]|uniref:FAD binding domain-containing protein n=1 Tax=Aspergillus campestris (strain IBT 28561) TaxID=1392248 RepID=A0A2I1D509_ASPC2|nr:FAD binding domain-containing protein [Aspergillus campestris IBT 28561]PKY04950.1 FAD binding domain-containing protein [Aspergillus campestris IBT 28561]
MGRIRRLWSLVAGKPQGQQTEQPSDPQGNSHVASPAAEPKNPTTSVLVIGAGSTGLALAQGLKQSGISCIVVEKHDSIDAHPRDWNMGLHWGMDPLRSLMTDEMWSHIQSAQVDPSEPPAEHDCIKFLNAQTGECMAAIPVQSFYRLRRRKLRGLLAQGLDIQYGKRLRTLAFSDDGKLAAALFDDNTSITASLVVGTDGARSTVRQELLGPNSGRIRQLPYCATFVQARFTAEQAQFLRGFHPMYLAGIHPAGYFAFFGMHDVEDPDKPETWTFFFYISWNCTLEEQDATTDWTNSQRLQQVKEFSKCFTDPWRSAFEWVPDDQQVWYMGLTDFDPRASGHRWDNHGGRVTLAGDAAHAMTYQRGQGLNHSITDAAKLVEATNQLLTGKSTPADAITMYEDEMIARAGGEVSLSTVNTEMVHDWQKVLQSPVLTAGVTKRSVDPST